MAENEPLQTELFDKAPGRLWNCLSCPYIGIWLQYLTCSLSNLTSTGCSPQCFMETVWSRKTQWERKCSGTKWKIVLKKKEEDNLAPLILQHKSPNLRILSANNISNIFIKMHPWAFSGPASLVTFKNTFSTHSLWAHLSASLEMIITRRLPLATSPSSKVLKNKVNHNSTVAANTFQLLMLLKRRGVVGELQICELQGCSPPPAVPGDVGQKELDRKTSNKLQESLSDVLYKLSRGTATKRFTLFPLSGHWISSCTVQTLTLTNRQKDLF